MALFHLATLTPSKAELISEWVPTQSWGPSAAASVEAIGAFRFDDPDGRVGLETHLVVADGVVMLIPLTYREEPLAGAGDALITEMNHSVLGTRWVYDGLRDPLMVTMLTGVAMTGQGEALGMVSDEGGRWRIAPSGVRIRGGGWTGGRVPVDGFTTENPGEATVGFSNDRFDLSVFRRPVVGPRPTMGLTAIWDGQSDPVVLAEVRSR